MPTTKICLSRGASFFKAETEKAAAPSPPTRQYAFRRSKLQLIAIKDTSGGRTRKLSPGEHLSPNRTTPPAPPDKP